MISRSTTRGRSFGNTNNADVYYWDARVGGMPQNITQNNQSHAPRLNDQGMVADYRTWPDQQIYFWDSRDGGKHYKISTQGGIYPQINQWGQVTWIGNDGHDDEIYYWGR